MNSRSLCLVTGVKATVQNLNAAPEAMAAVYTRTLAALYWDFA